ncbi:protein of unknown function [Paenibacillus alvei]|uniref:Uncharacterized protein n=1 Tax=Paenibacillus alvei TaxID=44250 RepID=A0A383RIG2_PAEAL|nr:protein of unknown function [Paenibacillus alvei]
MHISTKYEDNEAQIITMLAAFNVLQGNVQLNDLYSISSEDLAMMVCSYPS